MDLFWLRRRSTDQNISSHRGGITFETGEDLALAVLLNRGLPPMRRNLPAPEPTVLGNYLVRSGLKLLEGSKQNHHTQPD